MTDIDNLLDAVESFEAPHPILRVSGEGHVDYILNKVSHFVRVQASLPTDHNSILLDLEQERMDWLAPLLTLKSWATEADHG